MKQIIVLLIFITTFGCAGSGRNPGGESAISDDDSILVASGYEVVELAKLRTGHITATFMVNGKPCVFLVDTGGGATLIDYTKKSKYNLSETGKRNYAAGVGAVASLVRTSAVMEINGHEIRNEELFLMDITYINAEFTKNKVRQVNGVLGTGFLEKHGAIIDYPQSKMYLKL